MDTESAGHKLVSMLYEQHRAELLLLEEQAADDDTDAGKRMHQWCQVVRHCMMSWLVSCAARPRDRFGMIDIKQAIKRRVVDTVFTAHLDILLDTPLFQQLESDVRSYEKAEIDMGQLANVGAAERRTRAQLTGMERRMAELPGQVEQVLRPRLDGQDARLDDEHEIGLDRDFFASLPPDVQESFRDPDGTDPVGTQKLRDVRLRRVRFRAAQAGSMIRHMQCDRCIAEGAPGGVCTHLPQLVPSPRTRCFAAAAAHATTASFGPLAAATFGVEGSTDPSFEPCPVALAAAAVMHAPTAEHAAAASNLAVALAATAPGQTAGPLAAAAASTAAARSLVVAKSLSATAVDAETHVENEALSRENDILKAKVARSGLEQDPLQLKQLVGGVRQMLRVFLTLVAPKERQGTDWRSKVHGEKRAEALKQLLTKSYYPVLYVVMQRHIDDGMEIGAACAAVDHLRGRVDWKFISNLPKLEDEAKGRYKEKLLDADFAEMALAAAAAAAEMALAAAAKPSPLPPLPPPPEEEDHEEPTVNSLTVPIVEGASTRYIAIDPALSCGFAILQLNEAGQILSIDVGVLDVSSKGYTCDGQGDGARLNALTRQLAPLLSPSPDRVFGESFFGHSRGSDAISFKVRGAIEMLVAKDGVPYHEVAQQTWKKAVAGSGTADKGLVKTQIESKMGHSFPDTLYINRRWQNFRDDASDAVGIGLWGVLQHHSELSFAGSFRLAALGRTLRFGKPLVSSSTDVASSSDDVQMTETPLECAECTLQVNTAESEQIAQGTVYAPHYIADQAPRYLDWCKSLAAQGKFTRYELNMPGYGFLLAGPKIEWYRSDARGFRTKYAWGQTPRFWQAGYPMAEDSMLQESMVLELAQHIKVTYGDDVNHAILKWYADGEEQSSPPHQDKAPGVDGASADKCDMAGESPFYIYSFHESSSFEFYLQRGRGVPKPKGKELLLNQEDIVWRKALASGSLLKVSANDNRTLFHALHKKKGASERFSLIFRVIKTFIPIDAATAEAVNSDRYRFVSKAQIAAGQEVPTAEELKAAAEDDATSAASRAAAAGSAWPEVSRKQHNHAAAAAAHIVAQAQGPSTPPPRSAPRPDAWDCTLAPGCTLRCNHSGPCRVPDIGKRKRSGDGAARKAKK